jgi:hypothetical protein
MKLWIVGKIGKKTADCTAWDFQGVFDTEESAILHCGDREDWFIAPCELNATDIPEKSREWPGCWYPNLEDNPK